MARVKSTMLFIFGFATGSIMFCVTNNGPTASVETMRLYNDNPDETSYDLHIHKGMSSSVCHVHIICWTVIWRHRPQCSKFNYIQYGDVLLTVDTIFCEWKTNSRYYLEKECKYEQLYIALILRQILVYVATGYHHISISEDTRVSMTCEPN